MLRKLITILTLAIVGWTAISLDLALAAADSTVDATPTASLAKPTKTTGYLVQQASYDDTDGSYTLMLVNTPPGMASVYRTANLQMARLTDEQIASGQKTSLVIDGDRAVLNLSEDFRIEYQHSVTETQPDPQTGEPRTVVVRQESSFWSPFAGALAGQAIGNLLFAPRYYVPPIYHPGTMTGYGGSGKTYGQAVKGYQTKHNSLPPAVKNRQTLRTTGTIRKNPSSTSLTPRKSSTKATKSSGSGFGTSRLKSSSPSPFKSARPKGGSSFGSGGGFGGARRMPARSFGGGGGFRRR